MPNTPMRIALTLPSAAGLGAHEAGATAALVVALQRLSACGGRRAPTGSRRRHGRAASAGTLVAVPATRCLLAGLNPVHVLHRASVEEVSWRRLRRRAGDAPLSLDSIEPAPFA